MTQSLHRPLTPLSFQILVAVADTPRHGYGILKEIESSSGAPMTSSTGTLYLAIDRLERDGLLEEVERATGERRRTYRLTSLGRQIAAEEARRLAALVGVAGGKKLVDGRQIRALLGAVGD